MTARFLVTFVVLTAMVATQQPATVERVAQLPDARQAKAGWVERLEVGLNKTITSKALLQRIAFVAPRPPLVASVELDTHPVQRELPSPYRFCLPPPLV